LHFGGAATAELIIALLVTTVLVAAVSYHAIERPARHLLRARRSGHQIAALGKTRHGGSIEQIRT
jgi:peptidoglycan/LPS O-acetylase OafA/YrhL